MKTYDRIPPICDLIDSELQDRDYAIMELWHSLESYVKAAEQTAANPDEYARIVNHPILYKYEDFVNATKAIYIRFYSSYGININNYVQLCS